MIEVNGGPAEAHLLFRWLFIWWEDLKGLV